MTELSTRDFSRFSGRLRAYIAKRVDAAFVDDILSEILLRAVTHRDTFNQTDNPLAWLHTVAGNLITDHYRRLAAENAALHELQLEATEVVTVDEPDSRRELAPCLKPMIEALPESYREALLLTEIDGLTQAEAAARKGISVSGMKSRVQRGRDKLKVALLRCCEVEVNRQGRIVDHTPRGGNSPCNKTRG